MSDPDKKLKRVRFRTTRLDPQMKIRMPPTIKEEIDKEAEKNGRSRIAEILVRLGQSLQLKIKEDK